MTRPWCLLALLLACGDDASSPPDAAPTPDVPPAVLEDVHFIGRFDADRRYAWPGTRIDARFAGTGIAIELTDSGNNWFDVTIDGETTILRPGAGRATYELASGLADGEHGVSIARRTESFFGVTQFHAFTGAALVPSPPPARWIEVIGDSITCGYGVLGASEACDFSADTEAATHAWGQYTADALDAVPVMIAYSGIGMGRNLDGATDSIMPVRYLRNFADAASSTWVQTYTPDVVVINLGTNDFGMGDPGAQYRDAYVAFVRDELRVRYPAAEILLATSPMLSDSFPVGGMHRTKQRAHLDAIAATLADPRVHVVEVPQQQAADGLGCDYHPNEATQRKSAAAIVAAIRPLTGW